MGLNFRFRRTRCTGRIKDRPVVELRWTTEEGSYALEDLIAADLGGELPNAITPYKPTPDKPRTSFTPQVIEVDLTKRKNAVNIRQAATKYTPEAAYILDRKV